MQPLKSLSTDASSARADPARPPLAGVRVLDFTRLLPGPACTQILAELGAEVLRVDDATREDGGDFLRVPPGATPAERDAVYTGGALYEAVNRGKRSIALNLKHPEGRNLARQLAARSHVLVEGFRPGVMARLGLSHSTLLSEHPALVYCSISGYGQDGPWAQWAGHDINYLALTGVLERLRAPGGKPVLSSVQWADLASGALNATIGILAALYDARGSGLGRHLDIAMAQGLYGLQVSALAEAHARDTGAEAPVSDHSAPSILTGAVAAYQVYGTQDGRWLAVGALEPPFWRRFCGVIGRDDLIDQGLLDGQRGERAINEVTRVIATRNLSEWVEAFNGVDCCVTPVLSLSEAASRGPYPRQGHTLFPIRLGTTCLPSAPESGEHGSSVLADLGYDPDQIKALADQGVLGLPGSRPNLPSVSDPA